MNKGIDVSHWQGEIDFEKVRAAGIEYAFIKSTEGGTWQDKRFLTNFHAAKSSGVKAGAYHYFRGASSTPAQQRDNIVTMLTEAQYDFFTDYFAIDVESHGNENVSPDRMADKLHELLNLLLQEDILAEKPPLIYTSPEYWNNAVAGMRHHFSDYPLWIAHWYAEQPGLPLTWRQAGKSWTVWQYSSKGRVEGIEGDVDLDWMQFDQ